MAQCGPPIKCNSDGYEQEISHVIVLTRIFKKMHILTSIYKAIILVSRRNYEIST